MDNDFINQLTLRHQDCTQCPSTSEVSGFFKELLGILYPPFAYRPYKRRSDIEKALESMKHKFSRILFSNLLDRDESATIQEFMDGLPDVYATINQDIDAMYQGDPAARSHDEVIRAYPGFYAIAAYRIAHLMSDLGIHTIPRMITEHAHGITGIDIHPRASIGEYFCIDHGTGIVIGETTVIGDHVKIYQGVTLGALSVSKEDATTKRHPTIEDHVVVYAGATILGGETVVGRNSIIGGNVWLTQSVPPDSKVYYTASMSHTATGTTDTLIIK
jgi:serine O-acetyltransferase